LLVVSYDIRKNGVLLIVTIYLAGRALPNCQEHPF